MQLEIIIVSRLSQSQTKLGCHVSYCCHAGLVQADILLRVCVCSFQILYSYITPCMYICHGNNGYKQEGTG